MSNKFLNWDDSEGTPYRIPNIIFHESQLSWAMLTATEKKKYVDLEIEHSTKTSGSILNKKHIK